MYAFSGTLNSKLLHPGKKMEFKPQHHRRVLHSDC